MIDSNVILDIVSKDQQWFEWSSMTVQALVQENIFVINSIIYSEVSIGYTKN